MTAQSRDILIHRGAQYYMNDTPLDIYLEDLPKECRPQFVSRSTACWRGYKATWEIQDGRLFLVELEGHVRQGDRVVEVTLEDVFPWAGGAPLRAGWVSNWLTCIEGECVRYVHMGFASEYERNRIFSMRSGVLVEEWLRINPPPPVWYAIDPASGRRRRVYGPTYGDEALPDPYRPEETPSWERFRDEPILKEEYTGSIQPLPWP